MTKPLTQAEVNELRRRLEASQTADLYEVLEPGTYHTNVPGVFVFGQRRRIRRAS